MFVCLWYQQTASWRKLHDGRNSVPRAHKYRGSFAAGSTWSRNMDSGVVIHSRIPDTLAAWICSHATGRGLRGKISCPTRQNIFLYQKANFSHIEGLYRLKDYRFNSFLVMDRVLQVPPRRRYCTYSSLPPAIIWDPAHAWIMRVASNLQATDTRHNFYAIFDEGSTGQGSA